MLNEQADGIQAMVAPSRMCEGARKLRDVYARRPGVPFYQCEFGYYCLERWREQGMPQGVRRQRATDIRSDRILPQPVPECLS